MHLPAVWSSWKYSPDYKKHNFFAYKLSVATRSLPDQVQTPQPSINTLRFCKCPTAPVVQQHLMVLGLVKLNYVPRGMFGPFC